MSYRIAAAALFAATIISPAAHAATVIADPAKFVSDVYSHIVKTPGDYQEPDDIYTPRLAALFALEEKDSGGEVGRLDFDPWTNAQDNQLTNVQIKTNAVDGGPDRRIVVAKFKNIGKPEEIHFYFEHTKAGWKLDDMRSAGSDTPWTLSIILKYGWED